MTAVGGGVLRSHRDVTPEFLTEALRQAGWIGDAAVTGFDVSTIGAGQMAICARYDLRLDRKVAGAPRRVVGKFAAEDDAARQFMASSGYRNELCFYRHFVTRVSTSAPTASWTEPFGVARVPLWHTSNAKCKWRCASRRGPGRGA